MPRLKKSDSEEREDRIREAIVGRQAYFGLNNEETAKRAGWCRNRLLRRIRNPGEITLMEGTELNRVLHFTEEQKKLFQPI